MEFLGCSKAICMHIGISNFIKRGHAYLTRPAAQGRRLIGDILILYGKYKHKVIKWTRPHWHYGGTPDSEARPGRAGAGG